MCVAADVPLMESGTAGYLGQVQPIVKVCCKYLILIDTQAHSDRTPGQVGVFRLCAKTYTENLPGLHYPFDTLTANTLHCLGEELSHSVSSS